MRNIGVRITGSNADLDKRLAAARKSIREFARDVEAGQRGATKSIGETAAATARLGATAEKSASRTRTSARATAESLGRVSVAAKRTADESDRSAAALNRLGYSSGGIAKVAAAASLGAVGVAVLGRAIVTTLTDGIALSARFEAQMRNVNSITGMSETALGGLSQSVLDLSTAVPKEATDLAAGLYDIASSGFQGAAGLQVLEAAARAATAGISTTAVAGQAISGVLNAYGLSAASAKDVSDTLFQTVNLGVLSFDQLGQGIGDVIGTAAAAGISIDGVGAAIATMTKAGIKPAEAFTALNQLMSQIITPGEALTGVFESLGYESGASALATKGLNGVMADLQRFTGGNVTTMSALFPEIRSLKGALALTSDQGKLYAGVLAKWSAAHEGAGATAAALAEQMKSASAQWQLVVNAISAGTIEVGLKLLPVLTTLMGSMMDLARGAAPDLQAGVEALTPLFTALWEIGVDVFTMLKTIASVAAPAAGALASVAAGTVVTGLTAIAQALAAATGFVADHRDIVLALALVYGASLLPSLAATQIMFNKMILTPVVLGLVGVITAAEGGVVALRGLAASLLTVQTVATLGIGAALFLAARAFMMMEDAASKAKATFEGMGANTDVLDPAKMAAGVEELTKTATAANEVGKQYTGALGIIKGGLSLMGGNQELAEVANNGAEAAKALGVLKERAGNAAANLADLRATTGLSDAALIKLAKNQNIDLTKPPKDAADEMIKLRSYVVDLEKQTGLSSKGMAEHIGTDIEAMQAFADAIKAAQDKASASFTSGTDVLGTFDPKSAADKVKAAAETLAKAQQAQSDAQANVAERGKTTLSEQQQLAEAEKAVHDATGKSADKLGQARQNLADLQARLAEKGKTTVADTAAAGKAADDVAAAQAELTAARAASGAAGLRAAYKATIEEATRFSADITTATAQGLDYRVVARLLEQGPKTAGPILQTILSDHSGKMIKLVNDSEAQLSALNVIVVAQARLTAIAVGSATDQAIKDLPAAMQIQQAALADKGKLTLAQLSKNLGVSQDEVKRIAAAFGIDIATGLAPASTAVDRLSGKHRGLQAQLGQGATGVVDVSTDPAATGLDKVGRLMDAFDGRVASATVDVAWNFATADFPGKAAPVPTPLFMLPPKNADGGPLAGTYVGPRADNYLYRGTPKEYVMPVAAHDFYGTKFMDDVRARRLPRYADGGALGSRVGTGWGGSGVQVVKVPVHETRTSEFPLHIEHASFADPGEAREEYDARRRAANLGDH